MKEQDKKDFNEWINENMEKVKYAKLFINAFEDAFLCLSDIEDTQKRNETAFNFIEQINNYIQIKKIKDISTDNRRLNNILNRVKSGIDAGFVDCMQVLMRNTERTAKATEKRKEINQQNKQFEEERKEYHRQMFNQALNKVNARYGDKIAKVRDKINEPLEQWYQKYLNDDTLTGDLPFPNPKSKSQDEKNENIGDKMLSRACCLLGQAIGIKIQSHSGIVL